MSQKSQQRNLQIIWEYVGHPHAQELISEAIWLILSDDSDRCHYGSLDRKPRGGLNERASVEGDSSKSTLINGK
jgi:hypothetical protein